MSFYFFILYMYSAVASSLIPVMGPPPSFGFPSFGLVLGPVIGAPQHAENGPVRDEANSKTESLLVDKYSYCDEASSANSKIDSLGDKKNSVVDILFLVFGVRLIPTQN